MTQLTVSLDDELLAMIGPGGAVSFGRRADLVIADNKYLHRVLGEFVHDGARWWLRNRGGRIVIELSGDDRTLARIPPLSQAPVQSATSWVRFRAGSDRYELELRLFDPPPDDRSVLVLDGSSTGLLETVPLNDEQRLLLVTLAESKLRSPPRDLPLPTNAEIRARTGFRPSQIKRKLDYLCTRLDPEQRFGLWGHAGNDAVDRRSRLVEYVIEAGMIAPDDLALLDGR